MALWTYAAEKCVICKRPSTGYVQKRLDLPISPDNMIPVCDPCRDRLK